MKPIFDEEKIFLEKKLNIKLPDNCWRDGKKIYLNPDEKTLLIQFRIEKKQLIIKKNLIESVLKEYKNLTIEELIEINNERLDTLEALSIEKTIECMNRYGMNSYQYRVSDSGGKDSIVCMTIFQKAMDKRLKKLRDAVTEADRKYEVDFFNTTNDTADTYRQIKKNMKMVCNHQLQLILKRNPTDKELDEYAQEKLKEWIHNPEMGWYQWLKEVKNYYLPSVMVRNCCSTYKEGKVKELLDKDKNYVMVLGMRKYESEKRAEYDYYLNDKMTLLYKQTGKNKYKLNVPENWVRFLPIVEWTDTDIWLYILREGIPFNFMYRLGFNRVGCLCCPYASDYVDLLIEEYYPFLWERWCGIVEINYDLYNVENRLKWSKEEYIQEGKWKASTSKAQDYITKKPTEERVKFIADLYGISEELAKKYFKQTCSCGKRLNPDEVAMYLKLCGRYEGKEDNRTYLCKKCLCEVMGISKDDYSEKVKEFRSSGCNLF